MSPRSAILRTSIRHCFSDRINDYATCYGTERAVTEFMLTKAYRGGTYP
jgi:hypothetical protein